MRHLAKSVKETLGVVVKDWRRYRRALDAGSDAYLALCNRYERLEPAPDGSGYRCAWQWTSELHAPKRLPSLGLRLARRALAHHPIVRRDAPATAGNDPQMTFLIGHRGQARVPQLLATLESIAGQSEVDVECLVIEQDGEAAVRPRLPGWVTHVHTPPPARDMPYCRSWAFNVGAKLARGRILVLHDNDMLVPADYAREVVRRVAEGYEVANLKRFIFYLGERHSRGVIAREADFDSEPALAIVQNLEAGGSLAVTADAFRRIGGMDEAFVGWGGEDNEFWERAQTLRVWTYGYLPIVHLWHTPQPERLERTPSPVEYYRQRSALPVDDRIRELRARNAGDPTRPDPLWPAANPNG